MKITSYFGHRVRELGVHRRRWQQRYRSRSVVIFVSSGGPGSAADLRGWALGQALEQLGWRAIVVPAHLELSQRRRILRLEQPDVVLLQQSRHALNRPSLYPEQACVFDADDADILDPACREAVIACCRESRAVIAGSRFLGEQFSPYNDEVSVVWTGSYLPAGSTRPEAQRELVVAWAHRSPLGYPEEAELVREVILSLAKRRQVTFWLYGASQPAEIADYLQPLAKAGVEVKAIEPLAYDSFAQSLTQVAVGLHPVCESSPFSRGKSFGKLLAYIAAGVPVVTTHAVDHPLFFRQDVNGIMIEGNAIDAWTTAIESLLDDPAKRQAMADAASADYRQRLTTACMANHFDAVLSRVAGMAANSRASSR